MVEPERFGGADMTEILDDLFVGGSLSPLRSKAEDQINGILDAGITHVLDLRTEANNAQVWKALGVGYTHAGTRDAVGHHIPQSIFDTARKVYAQVRKAGGKLLAHCHMGVNRAPSVVYNLLLERGVGPHKAFDLIRSRRPQAAVWYAEDALAAHHLSNGKYDSRRQVASLRAHIDRVFSPDEQAEVNHYITQTHLRVDREWLESLQEGR